MATIDTGKEGYIKRLEDKLNELYPIGKRLLKEEKEAFLNKDENALREIRKESDKVYLQIRRIEESIIIAKSVK